MAEIKLASDQQRKLFFALCEDLDKDPEMMKERAKDKLGLASFTDISSLQISKLIDLMKLSLEKKHTHKFIPFEEWKQDWSSWFYEAMSKSYKISFCKCTAILFEAKEGQG